MIPASVRSSLLALHDGTDNGSFGDLHDHVHETLAALVPQKDLAAQIGWDEAQHRLLDSWRRASEREEQTGGQ